MALSDIGMVAGDTARSRVYLQAMEQEDLLPTQVLLMVPPKAGTLPGQQSRTEPRVEFVEGWEIDLARPVEDLLKKTDTEYETVFSTDINSADVALGVQNLDPSVLIYSGFGGGILRKNVLNLGKRFLHVHGGYLPEYRGSTTSYYSLLGHGNCGASSIFLSEEIDAGPVLLRREFKAPLDRTRIDYLYDSIFRSKVLIETLRTYAARGQWEILHEISGEGETYYIIHPVLKHIAILGEDEGQ